MSQKGDCEVEVESRMKASWGKWKEVSGVVCNKKNAIEAGSKDILHSISGSETWALRQKEEAKLERTEMRMLRWIMGISMQERLENNEIRRRAGMMKITEVIRES